MFNLQAVLEARKREEDAQRVRIAEIEVERRAREDRLAHLHRATVLEHAAARANLGEDPAGGGRINLEAVRDQARAIGAIQARAREEAIGLAGVMARLEDARRELVRASARRRAMELLRDRRLAEWRAIQARREHAAMDEVSSRIVAGAAMIGDDA